MKTHLNLATTDLNRSVEFYSTLLDVQPVKAFEDYALFVTEQPALELALSPAESAPAPPTEHYGIVVDTPEELERAVARLRSAGLALRIEREQTCCYANQSKVWTSDPSGRMWEIYFVHEEAEQRDGAGSTCC